MQWLSYTMSSTEKRRALPHGLVRFHSFWSELRDFWDSSLLRDTHTFQQELLKKYLDKKKGGVMRRRKENTYVLICTKFRALFYCYSLLKSLTSPLLPKEKEPSSTWINWMEHTTTMYLNPPHKQNLPQHFLLLPFERFKHELNGVSVWFTASYARGPLSGWSKNCPMVKIFTVQ